MFYLDLSVCLWTEHVKYWRISIKIFSTDSRIRFTFRMLIRDVFWLTLHPFDRWRHQKRLLFVDSQRFCSLSLRRRRRRRRRKRRAGGGGGGGGGGKKFIRCSRKYLTDAISIVTMNIRLQRENWGNELNRLNQKLFKQFFLHAAVSTLDTCILDRGMFCIDWVLCSYYTTVIDKCSLQMVLLLMQNVVLTFCFSHVTAGCDLSVAGGLQLQLFFSSSSQTAWQVP